MFSLKPLFFKYGLRRIDIAGMAAGACRSWQATSFGEECNVPLAHKEPTMHRPPLRFLICAVLILSLPGCGEREPKSAEQPVRGLRAVKVAAKAESRVRRFPTVLQPADVSSLSFEITGQLRAVTLTVGQKVQLGEVLAEIDP